MRDDKNKGLEHWLKDRSRAVDETFHQNVLEYIERPSTQTQWHTIGFYQTDLYLERARAQTQGHNIGFYQTYWYIERARTQTQGHNKGFYHTYWYIERATIQPLSQCIETLYRWIQPWLILRCNSGTGTLLSNLNLSSSKCGIVNILHTKIRAAFGIFLQKTHILINISFILQLEILKIK